MSRERRKVRVGRVVSDKMDKTVVVAVQWQQRHPLYEKLQRRIAKFYAHDGGRSCKLGDLVKIEETRAISHLKRWRVIDVLEHREVAEVKPLELDQALLDAQRRKQVGQVEVVAPAPELEVAEAIAVPENAVSEAPPKQATPESKEEAKAPRPTRKRTVKPKASKPKEKTPS